MSKGYTITEVRVALEDGVTVIATVSAIEHIKALVADIKAGGLRIADAQGSAPGSAPRHGQGGEGIAQGDTPISRLEQRASLDTGALERASVLGFKDDVPQLLRPGDFSVTDALLLLLFAVETGLGRSKIDYDAFCDLYEAQNIKSGSPLSMRLTDLRNSGYLDKRVYSVGRELRLTAKGERKAVEVLKKCLPM